MQGLDGCERMGLDDDLAIALILNTAKQEGDTTNFFNKKADNKNFCDGKIWFSNRDSGHYNFSHDHHMGSSADDGDLTWECEHDANVTTCDMAPFFKFNHHHTLNTNDNQQHLQMAMSTKHHQQRWALTTMTLNLNEHWPPSTSADCHHPWRSTSTHHHYQQMGTSTHHDHPWVPTTIHRWRWGSTTFIHEQPWSCTTPPQMAMTAHHPWAPTNIHEWRWGPNTSPTNGDEHPEGPLPPSLNGHVGPPSSIANGPPPSHTHEWWWQPTRTINKHPPALNCDECPATKDNKCPPNPQRMTNTHYTHGQGQVPTSTTHEQHPMPITTLMNVNEGSPATATTNNEHPPPHPRKWWLPIHKWQQTVTNTHPLP